MRTDYQLNMNSVCKKTIVLKFAFMSVWLKIDAAEKNGCHLRKNLIFRTTTFELCVRRQAI